MAAIGQPLDLLIVKQAGANTDGNANGNEPSTEGGSGEANGDRRKARATRTVRTIVLVSARRWSRSRF